MIVLSDQRKYQCSQITLERQSRNDSFVKGLVRWKENANRYLQPRTFLSLTRMIETRQFCRLQWSLQSWIGDEGYKSYSFEASRVFSRQALKGRLNLLQGTLWQ